MNILEVKLKVMFAFKAHNPYKQTFVASTSHLRKQIDELVNLQAESLELCDEIENNWVTFKEEIAQGLERGLNDPWYVKMYHAVKGGQQSLDAIELFEKHVDEYREKTSNLKDIRKVIVANLAHHEVKRKYYLETCSEADIELEKSNRIH